MPFIPHTPDQINAMLDTIGVEQTEALFDEIPQALRIAGLEEIPTGLNEMQVARLMRQRAATDGTPTVWAGAGAYEHHIPAAVWEITTRGEFYSAYTPYQSEASQGTLQLIFEYQTMMAHLTGMEVSNASLYDGASGLAEAVLMAVRAQGKSRGQAPDRVLMPATVHPSYRKVVRTLVNAQEIELVEAPIDPHTGQCDFSALEAEDGFAAVVLPFPDYFGGLADVDSLTDQAHAAGALVIAQVNPMALGLLKAPGEWGEKGADIVCGDGQPFGIPLSSGGPYFGFLCSRHKLVRQMPGRIAGKTTDADGNVGYALTLQAREQHIRRAKATSNICTNQGLMVTAATIYLAIVGPDGLDRVARRCHANTLSLLEKLRGIEGVQVRFDGPRFHEFVLELPRPADEVIAELAQENIVAGVSLGTDYASGDFADAFPGKLDHCLLICATETKNEDDLDQFAVALRDVLAA